MLKNERPPSKLSELLKLALSDSDKVDRSKFTPNAEVFHAPEVDIVTREFTGETCGVCLAGMVIVGSLTSEDQAMEDLTPTAFSTEWRTALYALDFARCGDYEDALSCLNQSYLGINLGEIPEPVMQQFDGWLDFDEHRASLEVIISELEHRGL